MTPEYFLEQIPLAESEPDVVRIWRDNLPIPREEVTRRFRWVYLEAPDPTKFVFFLSVNGENGSCRVGTAGYGIRHFFSRGRPLRGVLLVDLAVDPEHRTLAPALKLVRGRHLALRKTCDFTLGFPNEKSLGVVLRAGYRKVGTLTRFACVLHFSAYLRRHVKNETLSFILSLPLDLFQLLRLSARALRSIFSRQLTWGNDVDESFDDLWSKTSAGYDLLGARTACFLRWRFFSGFEKGNRVASLRRRGGDGALLGYAIVQRRENIAYIQDLLAYDEELRPLLSQLLPALWLEGCSSVSFCFLGKARVVDALRACGFTPREANYAVVMDCDENRPSVVSEGGPERWYFTNADRDT